MLRHTRRISHHLLKLESCLLINIDAKRRFSYGYFNSSFLAYQNFGAPGCYSH